MRDAQAFFCVLDRYGHSFCSSGVVVLPCYGTGEAMSNFAHHSRRTQVCVSSADWAIRQTVISRTLPPGHLGHTMPYSESFGQTILYSNGSLLFTIVYNKPFI